MSVKRSVHSNKRLSDSIGERLMSLAATLAFGSVVVGGLSGCPGPQVQESRETIKQIQIGTPYSSNMTQSDVRRTFQLRVQDAGKLRIKLSWNDPDGFVRFVVRGNSTTDSLDASARQELVKEGEVQPGIYYVELVGTGRKTTFNLLATLEPTEPQ